MPMLEVKDLVVSYGAIEALRGISFYLDPGEIVALIGSNGAGKTTTLRTISGLEQAKSGTITFMDEDITKIPAYKVVERRIAHVPEGRRVFPKMTVRENLMLGANVVHDEKLIKDTLDKVLEVFPRLADRRDQLAGTLSGGEQQMLALGRGLMTNGKLMLLDEPSMGLAPIIIEEIFETIRKINAEGTTILLIEQNAFLALHTANRAYVLETGTITLQGSASDLLNNDAVRQAYLGA